MCKWTIVTNRALCQEDFLERIRLLCRVGVDRIILREKDLAEKEYRQLAEKVLKICREYPTECVFHKFPLTASKLQADGIHVSVPDAIQYQESLQTMQMVGVSIHSLEQLAIAERCHADYVTFGHVFQTDCKPGLEPKGIEGLKKICKHSHVPVYAIGGISPQNAGLAFQAGAAGVCVMSWGMRASEDMMKRVIYENDR